MPDLPRFKIIREPEFEEQLERLFADMEEADNFTLGAEFIPRARTAGRPASKPRRINLVSADESTPRARGVLYYTFDERAVTFLFIVAFDE